MARVPMTADFRLRQLLEYTGLASTPAPVRRSGPGIGIAPANRREPNWPVRRPPPPLHQRSERPT